MHKIINIHQKSLSKKGHHENDPKVLAKGSNQATLIPCSYFFSQYTNFLPLFPIWWACLPIFCLCSDLLKSSINLKIIQEN